MTPIKTIELSTGKWLLIEVPVHSWGYELSNEKHQLRFWEEVLQGTITSYIDLPKDHTYSLVFKASELTEDQWKVIMDHAPGSFEFPSWRGFSLLKAHGLSPDTCIIIKQED